MAVPDFMFTGNDEDVVTITQAQVFQILESITDAFIALDRQWRLIYVNQEATRLLRQSREALLGQTLWESVLQSATHSHLHSELQRAFANQTTVEFEDFLAELDIWIQVHAYPSANRLSIYFCDITEAKRNQIIREHNEIRLEEHQRLLQQVTDTVPGILYVYDLIEQQNVYVNGQVAEMIGYTPEQVQAMGACLFLQLVHPDDLVRFPEHIQQFTSLQDGKVLENEYRMRNAAGEWRWFSGREIVFSRTASGQPKQILGSAYDITDRKRLLNRLQRYTNQLRGLTKAALVMNSVLSVEDVLQAITEQAQSIIGAHLVVTSLVENHNWDNAIHARYLSDKYAEWRDRDYQLDGSGIDAEVCRHNRPLRLSQAEMVTRSRDQSSVTQAPWLPLCGLLAAPLNGRNGQNIGLIQLCDREDGDFTEADEDILVQLAQMASVAIENTRLYTAEQRARTQAEAANRIKDEFLAVLSHELRSPLNPILGWSRMMRQRKMDEETSTYALETIERNAKLQTQLIEDLLDVSRILQGKMSLSFCPVDLATTINAAMETVRLAAEAKAISIHATLQPAVDRVLGDANRLQQIVWNLLSNAVKFTPAHGQVEIKLEQTNGFAQITVTDTGKGIDPNFLPHIFEYFRQEESATTRKFGGLGLGLAIVRHIVELHGGSIDVDSAGLGSGATFVVKIPLLDHHNQSVSQPEKPNLAGERSLATPLLQGLPVLVVDDEADARDLAVYVLEQAGAVATTASSAREAIVILSKSHFDVLVCDIGMPEMDGYMLIRQVRSHISRNKQTIPAIALTAYAGEFNHQQAIEAGFQYHLPKPIEPTELVAVVARLVGRDYHPI